MAKPISVEPSQGWDGNDGPWSTFAIRVGNPPQPLRVLASTTVPETWVVHEEGCTSSDGSKCPNARGNLYNQSLSTTWDDQGLFGVGVEANLNYVDSDNGDYGFDTLALGYNGSGGLSLDQQVIAGIATKDFYLGSLGLAPWRVNFSLTESSPSYLSNLKNQSHIPSLSFGYSAGAPYRLKKVDGTLTLGGYDASRFAPNGISFPFASDISRNLVVGLQSIEFSDSNTEPKNLLSAGILTFVDSTVPHIWLPVSACKLFEDAFGITYDRQTDLYLVNDTLRDTLLAQNASVTFVIGNDVEGGDTVNITFPYHSFDLEASYRTLNGTTRRYFPLRRAANDTQYTLGRTFLQESYLVVDFERANFSLSQATFIENAEQKLIPILSKDDASPNITITHDPPKSSRSLSGGAVAGIVVGIALILLIGAAVFIIRRRRAHNGKETKVEEPERLSDKPELDGQGKPFIGELYNPHGEADSREVFKTNLELDATTQPQRAEMQGSHGGIEMVGSRGGAELEGGNAAVELEAISLPVELPSPYPRGSAIPSPRTRSHKHSSTPAAEEGTLQLSGLENPEPPLPRSSTSLSPSSRLRANPPPTIIGGRDGKSGGVEKSREEQEEMG